MSTTPPFFKNEIPSNPPLSKGGRGDFGFTLLEILIAVAILATSFVVLLSSSGNSFLESARAERMTRAVTLSRQKMVELEMGFAKDMAKNKAFGEDKEENGTFDEPFDDYRWSYTIKKVEIPVKSEGGGGGGGENGEEGGGESDLAIMQDQMKTIMDKISKLTREVQLTVYWGDKDVLLDKQPHMTVTTHWVKMNE